MITRAWAMASPNTFSIKPIRELLDRYMTGISIDPFARDSMAATHRNDLNPNTAADYHLDATKFLDKMIADGVRADVVLLDPPYSISQAKECYNGVGIEKMRLYAQWKSYLKDIRDRTDQLLCDDGIVISFGWNSVGMGKNRGYAQTEILLVCHGSAHNDTIITVERKLSMEHIGTI